MYPWLHTPGAVHIPVLTLETPRTGICKLTEVIMGALLPAVGPARSRVRGGKDDPLTARAPRARVSFRKREDKLQKATPMGIEGTCSPAEPGSSAQKPWPTSSRLLAPLLHLCEFSRMTPGLSKGNIIFPWSTRNVVYGAAECSPRDSKLLCSLKHACMNNRSSADAERLVCNFSRRLKSLSRVLAEVTAYLSYSGPGETGLCRWR